MIISRISFRCDRIRISAGGGSRLPNSESQGPLKRRGRRFAQTFLLCPSCLCVKALSPGMDLLLSTNWKEAVGETDLLIGYCTILLPGRYSAHARRGFNPCRNSRCIWYHERTVCLTDPMSTRYLLQVAIFDAIASIRQG